VRPFHYVAATTERAAIDHAAAGDARFVAGGTTLIDLMKLHVERPRVVVGIDALPLASIEPLPDGGVRVGAMTRNSDMAHHPLIRSRYPMLSQAILAGASAQVRNMATTGGNLLQRTRCYYFRDTAMRCSKREPGAGCSAIEGYNRIHAVLGVSEHCIATHPSDMCVALAALDADLRLRGPRGERVVALAEFYTLPGDHPQQEHVLRPGELITAVDIPPLRFGARSAYVKVRDRASFAFALASAAAALDIQDGAIHDARIALGGVATIPWRAQDAEAYLVGRHASRETYRAAADLAMAGALPHRDNAFKIDLARRTLVRALMRAGAAG